MSNFRKIAFVIKFIFSSGPHFPTSMTTPKYYNSRVLYCICRQLLSWKYFCSSTALSPHYQELFTLFDIIGRTLRNLPCIFLLSRDDILSFVEMSPFRRTCSYNSKLLSFAVDKFLNFM